MVRPLSRKGKETPGTQLDMRLSWSQSRSDGGEEKNLYPRQRLNPGRHSRSSSL
jgi:hypothetical protein